ncbi:hypothetical protein Efla_002719 [Eimeria flavescens]
MEIAKTGFFPNGMILRTMHKTQQQQQQRQQQQQQLPLVCKVKVEHLGEKRGRGIVATEAVDAGAVIYTEVEPLAAAQHAFSRLCGLTCSNCLEFVGSLADCLRHILSNARLVDSLRSLDSVPESFWESQGLEVAGGLPCGEADCEAVFCSPKCREHAREQTYHRVVCVDAASRGPWNDFLAHARQHHDGLALAGQCVAQVLFDVTYRGLELEAAMAPYKAFYSSPW